MYPVIRRLIEPIEEFQRYQILQALGITTDTVPQDNMDLYDLNYVPTYCVFDSIYRLEWTRNPLKNDTKR